MASRTVPPSEIWGLIASWSPTSCRSNVWNGLTVLVLVAPVFAYAPVNNPTFWPTRNLPSSLSRVWMFGRDRMFVLVSVSSARGQHADVGDRGARDVDLALDDAEVQARGRRGNVPGQPDDVARAGSKIGAAHEMGSCFRSCRSIRSAPATGCRIRMIVRIKTISLSWFRGAAHLVALAPECKSIVVYGVNGSGKSSFVDAVEYVLNDGRVGHLAHEYSGKHLQNALPNTHKPPDAKTELSIKVCDGSAQQSRLRAMERRRRRALSRAGTTEEQSFGR